MNKITKELLEREYVHGDGKVSILGLEECAESGVCAYTFTLDGKNPLFSLFFRDGFMYTVDPTRGKFTNDYNKIIEVAREKHEREGIVEIDTNPRISPTPVEESNDGTVTGGCYVQAWVWVDQEDIVAKLRENPNQNCLEGVSCPACGSYGPFRITGMSSFLVHDDGTESHADVEWVDNAHTVCVECAYSGELCEFKDEYKE